MKKTIIVTAVALATLLLSLAACKKNETHAATFADAPRTSPIPTALQGQWNMTASGTDYIYDGWHYGNSGTGRNVHIKSNGSGWWNEIWRQATPSGCLLVQNLSLDNTFELKTENGVPVLYTYTTGGTYHGEGCTTTTDIILKGDKIYPEFPPYKYYYKIASLDNQPSQPVLVLSQESDETIRFDKAVDKTMSVLKKQ